MGRLIGGRRALWLASAIIAATVARAHADVATLPMLASKGTKIVDPAGKVVILKGCNLGNYLMLESWMFGGTLQSNGENFHDQASLFKTMRERFGDAREAQLMDTFRESWITPRDFDVIKSFGFNVVRLPFDYRLLQDDASPDSLRPDAFKWIDHVLTMAEAANVYVILDLHGTPGGQSNQDHTGESGQNKLWHDDADQKRTIAIWKAIAEHCKERSVVAAYDLINEPYGDYHEDVRPELATLMPRIADAIRATGDKHVVFFSGALNGGIAFYGQPKASGVAFTEHYYPGLFGSKSALETHARLLGQELPAKKAYLEKVNAPYFVGEFNVVLPSEDPNRIMRAYYDRFAEYGWASTMWSYKLIKPEAGGSPGAWYAATNGEALARVDVAKDSDTTIEAFFKSLATTSVVAYEPLKKALTEPKPAPLYLARYEPLATAVPATPSIELDGYSSADVGHATPGHTLNKGGGTVEVLGGGTDINATSDSFRFVSKPAHGATNTKATLTTFVDSAEYAKAGVMARWGDSAGAAMAMVNVFPDGTIALVSRPTEGAPTTETKVGAGVSLPVQLRLQVADGKATASYRTGRGEWLPVASAPVPNDADYRTGLAVCAHLDAVLTRVVATLGEPSDAALPVALSNASAGGPSLLKNGSFEQQGTDANLAADWNRWGDWIDRETTWSPTHEGKALIAYHHWQIDGKGGSSGLWQDVKVTPGKRYAFTVYAQHDAVDDAGKQDAKTIELRLESVTPDGEVTLNSRDFAVPQLATGKAWSKLVVNGTAASDTIRVLAVLNSADADRGGAVKLDSATLTIATDGK